MSPPSRVLKPEGRLLFTDLMAADDCPPERLRPVPARLGVEAFATPGFYRQQAYQLGFTQVDFEDRNDHVLTHYLRLAEETAQHSEELAQLISPTYLDGLHDNLPRWIEACRRGEIRWGIFACRR